MEWAKQAAAQAKQLRERAAQEASKLQESYKDGTLASPLAERLSLDAVSTSLKEGRQKLREGVETAIEAGADASRRTMDAMGENERVDEVIKSKNARILALEEERARHRHALAEAVKAAKQKAEELDLVKERAVARFKVLQDEKTQSDGARAALQAELDRLRAAAPAPPLIDLAGGGGGGRDDDDFDSPASAKTITLTSAMSDGKPTTTPTITANCSAVGASMTGAEARGATSGARGATSGVEAPRNRGDTAGGGSSASEEAVATKMARITTRRVISPRGRSEVHARSPSEFFFRCPLPQSKAACAKHAQPQPPPPQRPRRRRAARLRRAPRVGARRPRRPHLRHVAHLPHLPLRRAPRRVLLVGHRQRRVQSAAIDRQAPVGAP